MFLGTSPFRAPAMYHLMSHLDLDDGVYYPMGGFAALVDAMERLAREAGVQIETRATARRIITGPSGDKARCEAVVWTDADGTQQRTPARTVVAAADLHHVETELLPAQLRSHPEPVWRRRDPGPSAVLVCLGVRGKLPELAHHNLLFTRDWKDNFGRIQAGRALADETSIYVCKPSATDDGVAPEGDENLFILVPTPAAPAWGNGGDDGEGSAIVESVADAAIDQLAAWTGVANLRGRIAVRRTYGPGDFVDGFNAWRGSALGAAHTLRQSAFLRPGNRSGKVEGLHYAGSSVRPGIGVPMCLISAELVLKAVQGIKTPGALPEPAVRRDAVRCQLRVRRYRGEQRMIYLAVLVALLGCMALLDARYKLFFFARPLAATVTMAVGLAYFLAWDVWAISLGIFLHRESPLMTGIMLGPQLPLEEAFFLAFLCYQTMILFTGLLAWGRHRRAARRADTQQLVEHDGGPRAGGAA